MKCGDRGFKNAIGEPCGQNISPHARACLWHTRDAGARRLLAAKGAIASRLKRALPSSYQIPELVTIESIIAFARELIRLALTEDVDLRRVSEARGGLALMVSAFSVREQGRLVDALLRLEHGGVAFAFLTRLQDGLAEGRRRPLPGRVTVLEGETS